MNPDYVKDVRRFGAKRLKDESGEPLNISHEGDCRPDEIRTDGRGNIIGSPLIWRKPCIGRPERLLRGYFGGVPFIDVTGERRPGDTPCNRCADGSPGIFESCGRIVDERIASSAAILSSLNAWTIDWGDDFGPSCFTGRWAKRWEVCLQTIIDHGGWTSVNDDQVKLEAIRRQKADRDKRNADARATRRRQRMARRGAPMTITREYFQALEIERNRRAERIKGLRGLSGRSSKDMLWLNNLPDDSCERIADVWRYRELLSRELHKVTGRAIAELMVQHGRSYGLSVSSLTTRVHDDLKRIAKFEDRSAGAPIWEHWAYSDGSKGAHTSPVFSPP